MRTTPFIIGLSLMLRQCLSPHEISDAVVTERGVYKLCDAETAYCEMQNMVTVDKHDRCIRGPVPFGDDIKVGDQLGKIAYHRGLAGPCDYIVSYEK